MKTAFFILFLFLCGGACAQTNAVAVPREIWISYQLTTNRMAVIRAKMESISEKYATEKTVVDAQVAAGQANSKAWDALDRRKQAELAPWAKQYAELDLKVKSMQARYKFGQKVKGKK